MTLEEQIASLRSLNILDGDPAVVEQFESMLGDIVASADPAIVAPLCDVFDDSDPEDLMFSVVHGIESVEDAAYVRELVAALPRLRSKAPRWCSTLVLRVLNEPNTRDELVRCLRNSSTDVRVEAHATLHDIEVEYAELAPVVQSIVAQLESRQRRCEKSR